MNVSCVFVQQQQQKVVVFMRGWMNLSMQQPAEKE
jgi:hypothetical protein